MATYLSEPITLKFTLPKKYTGTNVSFVVYNYDTDDIVYTGSVYATGNEQILHLNDIVYNLNDTYNWFANFNYINSVHEIKGAPFITNLKVVFNNNETFYVNDILHATKIPNSKDNYYKPMIDTKLTSFTSYGTGVLPRIPRNPDLNGRVARMFCMLSLAYTGNFRSNNRSIELGLYNDNRILCSLTEIGSFNNYESGITKQYLGGEFFNLLYNKLSPDNNGTVYLGARGNSQEVSTHTKLIAIDNDNAEFYVMWINRLGAWQCQPLCAKSQMTENVTTQNIVTLTDDTIPCTKTSQFKWTLNTHWLNYAEHEEFESLLTSKYVYLFNTKTNEGHYVTVTDSNWTFKNASNTKKPFNLTLNLSKSYKQNIIF